MAQRDGRGHALAVAAGHQVRPQHHIVEHLERRNHLAPQAQQQHGQQHAAGGAQQGARLLADRDGVDFGLLVLQGQRLVAAGAGAWAGAFRAVAAVGAAALAAGEGSPRCQRFGKCPGTARVGLLPGGAPAGDQHPAQRHAVQDGHCQHHPARGEQARLQLPRCGVVAHAGQRRQQERRRHQHPRAQQRQVPAPALAHRSAAQHAAFRQEHAVQKQPHGQRSQQKTESSQSVDQVGVVAGVGHAGQQRGGCQHQQQQVQSVAQVPDALRIPAEMRHKQARGPAHVDEQAQHQPHHHRSQHALAQRMHKTAAAIATATATAAGSLAQAPAQTGQRQRPHQRQQQGGRAGQQRGVKTVVAPAHGLRPLLQGGCQAPVAGQQGDKRGGQQQQRQRARLQCRRQRRRHRGPVGRPGQPDGADPQVAQPVLPQGRGAGQPQQALVQQAVQLHTGLQQFAVERTAFRQHPDQLLLRVGQVGQGGAAVPHQCVHQPHVQVGVRAVRQGALVGQVALRGQGLAQRAQGLLRLELLYAQVHQRGVALGNALARAFAVGQILLQAAQEFGGLVADRADGQNLVGALARRASVVQQALGAALHLARQVQARAQLRPLGAQRHAVAGELAQQGRLAGQAGLKRPRPGFLFANLLLALAGGVGVQCGHRRVHGGNAACQQVVLRRGDGLAGGQAQQFLLDLFDAGRQLLVRGLLAQPAGLDQQRRRAGRQGRRRAAQLPAQVAELGAGLGRPVLHAAQLLQQAALPAAQRRRFGLQGGQAQLQSDRVGAAGQRFGLGRCGRLGRQHGNGLGRGLQGCCIGAGAFARDLGSLGAGQGGAQLLQHQIALGGRQVGARLEHIDALGQVHGADFGLGRCCCRGHRCRGRPGRMRRCTQAGQGQQQAASSGAQPVAGTAPRGGSSCPQHRLEILSGECQERTGDGRMFGLAAVGKGAAAPSGMRAGFQEHTCLKSKEKWSRRLPALP